MKEKITIVVADDHRIFRKGLKSLLSEKTISRSWQRQMMGIRPWRWC